MLKAENARLAVLSSSSVPIGEILLQNNVPLLKMWNVSIQSGERIATNHSHSRFEITVCEDGYGEYTTNNSVYEISPGDVFVFSANEQHCITKTGPDGLKITNLHFDPRYLLTDERDARHESIMKFCFSHSPNFQNRIPSASSLFLRDALGKIKAELELNDKNQFIAIYAYLNLMLIDILRNHKYRIDTELDSKTAYSGIFEVYDYVDAHLDEDLSLKTLSNVAGFSPNYFSHIFKKLNGISLWDYITTRRIEKAVKLLSESSSYKMLDIALNCGFNNTANFNKAFKKLKGVTPREYKKDQYLHFH